MHSLPAHLINLATLQLARLKFDPFTKIEREQEPPLLVTGIFRSGTSATTLLLSQAGFDVGPPDHLLQARGKYEKLNPDGYLENYFFIELSIYLFHLLKSAGDAPPDENAVEKLTTGDLSDDAFRKFCLLGIHDDRVSNVNKMRVLSRASVHHIAAYVNQAYGKKPLIKNPHFCVLEPFFTKLFPRSQRIVVFRNPADWLRSVPVVSRKADYALYDRYYSGYLERNQSNVHFFNYDELLRNPVHSINRLLETTGIPNADAEKLAKLVRVKKPEAEINSAILPETWRQLKARALNA
jgi:hypothetical protein